MCDSTLLADACVRPELLGGRLGHGAIKRVRLSRSVHSDLANVGVAAILMHGDDRNLQEKRSERALGIIWIMQWDADPVIRLDNGLYQDLLQVVRSGSSADRHFARRVALIELVIEVHGHLFDRHLLEELDVDEMGLRPVRLPIRVGVVLSRSWSTPFPGLALESDHTASSPTSRRCSSDSTSSMPLSFFLPLYLFSFVTLKLQRLRVQNSLTGCFKHLGTYRTGQNTSDATKMEPPSDATSSHEELHALIAVHAADTGGALNPAPNATTHPHQDVAQHDASINTVSGSVHDSNGSISVSSTRFGDLQLLDASAMTLSVSDLDHASDQFLASGLTGTDADSGQSEVGDLSYLQPEVLHWMTQCRDANGGISASEDDVLYYFDTKYPELLRPDTCGRLFDWLHDFLVNVSTTEPPRFSSEVKEVALHTLYTSPEATPALVVELGLKSTTTLQFWQHQQAKISAAATPSLLARQPTTKRRAQFAHEAQLVEWLLSHKHTPITNQDIVSHLENQYPDFVKGRTNASVSTWVARFLKRHLPSEASMASNATDPSDTTNSAREASDEFNQQSSDDQQHRKRRAKRKSPNGYVLHSNEFKLNALKKLDEGKTYSEVAEELDLKCPNTLVYWNSIRDKLAVADKKRFRLAGGGRRSTCTFEDELMAWVSDRDQKGELTDVKSVLEYLMENHSSFTDGKKEPTLRKWILRFFQRWRQRSVQTGATTEDVDEMDKTHGILV